MIHIFISFIIHWLMFCIVANFARLILLQLGYPLRLSVKDLVVLTGMTALISGILHILGFILFENYMIMLFNYLHYIQ